MLAKINFLISVYCSVAFHAAQFYVENDRFSTFMLLSLLLVIFTALSLRPAEMAAGFEVLLDCLR